MSFQALICVTAEKIFRKYPLNKFPTFLDVLSVFQGSDICKWTLGLYMWWLFSFNLNTYTLVLGHEGNRMQEKGGKNIKGNTRQEKGTKINATN